MRIPLALGLLGFLAIFLSAQDPPAEKKSPTPANQPASGASKQASFEAELSEAEKAGSARIFGPGWSTQALTNADQAKLAQKSGNFVRANQLWDLARSQLWFPNALIPKDVNRALGDPRFRVPDLVTSMAVHPGSGLLAAGLRDGTVLVWEMPSGRLRHRLTGLTEDVLALAFHPTDPLLFAGGKHREVLGWSLKDGTVVRRLGGHSEQINTLVFTGDGSVLASAGADLKIRLYKSGKDEPSLEITGPSLMIHQVAFSPDGKLIAAASADCKAWVFQAESGDRLSSTLLFPQGNAFGVAFFQQGMKVHLAVGGANPNQIKVIDPANGTEIRNFEPFPRAIQTLQMSPQGQLLLAGSQDGTVRLIDPKTGQTLRNQLLDDGFRNLALAGDASWFAIASNDSLVAIRDLDHLTSGKQIPAEIGEIWSMAFWKGNRAVVAGGSRPKLAAFDLGTMASIGSVETPSAPISAVASSRDGQKLAVGLASGAILLIADNGTVQKTLSAHQGTITSLTWSSEGSRLASASTDGSVKWWDPDQGKELQSWSFPLTMALSLSLNQSNDTLAAGFGDGVIRLFRLGANSVPKTLGGHQGAVTGVAFDPTGARLASCGNDQRAILWTLSEKGATSIQLVGSKAPLSAIAFAPQGTLVAAAGADRVIRVWDTNKTEASGSRLERMSFRGHTDWVTWLGFHPSGSQLLSGSVDGQVRTWDIILVKETRVPVGHVREVRALAWHPKAPLLVSAGADGTCLLWDLESNSTLPKKLYGSPEAINSITWLGETRQVAFALQTRSILTVNAENGELIHTETDSRPSTEIPVLGYWQPKDGPMNAIAWIPPITIEIVPTKPGRRKETMAFKDPSLGTVKSLALSPEGDLIAAGGEDGKIRFWETGSLVKLREGDLEALTEPVADIALSQGRKLLAAADAGGRTTLWDLQKRQKLGMAGAPGKGLAALALKPDGSRLLVASIDNRVTLFEGSTGKELKSWDFRDTMGETKKRIRSISFSPAYPRAALGLSDGMILILDTP